MEAGDSKTSSVTSMQSIPKRWAMSAPTVGVRVVERRQAVHELGRRLAGRLHHLAGDPVGREQLDAFAPVRFVLAHGEPDVGVDEVGATDRSVDIFGHGEPCAMRRADRVEHV